MDDAEVGRVVLAESMITPTSFAAAGRVLHQNNDERKLHRV